MHRHRTALLALAAVATLATAAGAQQPQPSRETKTVPATGRNPERQIICRGAAVPQGWLLVDNLKDRTMCGGENAAVYNAYNVWAIERHDNRPSGAVMTVCASVPTPGGWTVVDVYRKNDVCGHPTDPFAVNVKVIRKNR